MARSDAAQSAEVISLFNTIAQSGQREREQKDNRSFEGMLNQWNQLATAQRQREQLELTNTMETMRAAETRRNTLKDKITNYGLMMKEAGGEAGASPGFVSALNESAGRAEQQYNTLEDADKQHRAKLAQTMQRIEAINKQSEEASQMDAQFQQGFRDAPTAEWVIQKYGGSAGEGGLDRMRVNKDELMNAIQGLPEEQRNIYTPGSASFMGLMQKIDEMSAQRIKENLESRKVGAHELSARTQADRLKQDKVLRPGEILALADDRFGADVYNEATGQYEFSPEQKEKRFAFIKEQFSAAKMGESGWSLSNLYDYVAEETGVPVEELPTGPGFFSKGGPVDQTIGFLDRATGYTFQFGSTKKKDKAEPEPKEGIAAEDWRKLKTASGSKLSAKGFKKRQPERYDKAKAFLESIGEEPSRNNIEKLLWKEGVDKFMDGTQGSEATTTEKYSPDLIKRATQDLKDGGQAITKRNINAQIAQNPDHYGI